MSDGTFPDNPTHGMLFEQKNGVIYQYDASIRSWIKLATDNLLMKLVSPVSDGAMSADDLAKLNRLVIPVPKSTIIGNKCTVPFKNGVIDMRGGDNFIGVTGKASLQNIDQYGDLIKKDFPFQIHQHTYGFDFTLDVRQLISELESRGQIKLQGKRGAQGDKGPKGDDGLNGILSGPQGDPGVTGTAPDCPLTIEPEVLQTQIKDGNKKALVDARVVPNPIDSRKYSLIFDRQVVGNPAATATQFNLRNVQSTWILATGINTDESTPADPVECGIPGQRGAVGSNNSYNLYYVDIQPIMDAIHQKFLDEIDALKSGYEKSVDDWLQQMSDLFDEQKRALCCALERCISLTKSNHLREHMESVAATAIGKAKIVLNSRDSTEAVEISHTRPLKQLGNTDLCENGPEFPQNPAAEWRGSTDNGTKPLSTSSLKVTIDPLTHSSASNSNTLQLAKGHYTATLSKADATVNGKHRSNARIRFIQNGTYKTIAFMDKGTYSSLSEARAAYNGLSVSFRHDGGPVNFYLPNLSPSMTYGEIEINVEPSKIDSEVKKTEPPKPTEVKSENACLFTSAHLKYYERAWQRGDTCGCVINISGQDYIVVRKSVTPDDSCGGGEDLETECMSRYSTNGVPPAIAWPTFDGNSFIALPKGEAMLMYDQELSDLVIARLNSGDVSQKRGTIYKVLFPIK